jgi:putative colanic acid biosynthesis UDP-glucose lipid carrier transferase
MARAVSGSSTDREVLLAGGLRAADVVVVALTGYLAWLGRSGIFLDALALPSFYLAAYLLAGLLTANVMHLLRAYDLEVMREPLRLFARGAGGWLLVALALLVVGAMTKTTSFYSRLWFVLWLLLALLALMAMRALAVALLSRWKRAGSAGRRIALVGQGRLAQEVAGVLLGAPSAGITIVGHVAAGQAGAETAPAPLASPSERLTPLGRLEDLPELIERHRLQEIVLAVPWSDIATVATVMGAVRALPVDVRMVPEPELGGTPVHGVSILLGMPMLDLWRRPMSEWDRLLKAAEDRLLAALLLLVAALPMALIALAIRLETPGPVLFRQRRAGFGRAPFVMLKFRSMHDGQSHGSQLHGGPAPAREVPQARRNDPRVTRVGRILRRTSLDELPQLLNVLRGEMSLVGPRPHAVEHDSLYAELIGDYLARQRVKPGMTGWAQIHGLRGETETPDKMHQRVAMDLYYIDHWSLGLDLKILALTPLVVLLQENAY